MLGSTKIAAADLSIRNTLVWGIGLILAGIVLWLLGGVSKLNGDADSADDERRIAIVGPLTSALLAAGFFVLSRIAGAGHPAHPHRQAHATGHGHRDAHFLGGVTDPDGPGVQGLILRARTRPQVTLFKVPRRTP